MPSPVRPSGLPSAFCRLPKLSEPTPSTLPPSVPELRKLTPISLRALDADLDNDRLHENLHPRDIELSDNPMQGLEILRRGADDQRIRRGIGGDADRDFEVRAAPAVTARRCGSARPTAGASRPCASPSHRCCPRTRPHRRRSSNRCRPKNRRSAVAAETAAAAEAAAARQSRCQMKPLPKPVPLPDPELPRPSELRPVCGESEPVRRRRSAVRSARRPSRRRRITQMIDMDAGSLVG